MSTFNEKIKTRIENLDTPEKCEIMFKNCMAKGCSDLANLARTQAIKLRADSHNPQSPIERELLQAAYAYQEVLQLKHGKKILAVRTWQLIKKYGIVRAAEKAIDRPDQTQGYESLKTFGLEGHSFESVVTRHPGAFSPGAVEISKARILNAKN